MMKKILINRILSKISTVCDNIKINSTKNKNRIFKHMNKAQMSFLALLFLFTMSSASWAATYYVDISAGNDTNPGTLSNPWKTIGKANSTLKGGDTVFIKKGTYKQTIRPKNSGSKGNYITYSRYRDDEVVITGVDGADLHDRSYVVIDGLKFLNVEYFVQLEPNGHHNIIQNCHMEEGGMYRGINLDTNANYNKILNNTLIGKCEPSDLIKIVDSGHNLIEGNKLYYGTHNAITVQDRSKAPSNSYNIIRNNYIQNNWHSNISIYGVEYLLVENNIVVDAGEDRKKNTCGTDRDRTAARENNKGIMANTKYSIYRNNILVNNGSALILSSDIDPAWKGICKDNRFYQNTLNQNFWGIRHTDPSSAPSLNNVIKNNIVNNGVEYAIRISGKNEADYYVNNNVLGGSVKYAAADVVTGNLSVDPLFTDTSRQNFTLQSKSRLIDAGAWLTTTTSAGNGTQIPVADARYFMDGWGIIEGDLIQLEGQTRTARVTGVNYKTNTIILDTSLSWAKGQGVSLPYQGNAPDIGALEYSNGSYMLQPPYNFRIVYN